MRKPREITACRQCEDPAVCRGLCEMHYQRWRRKLPMWPPKGSLNLDPNFAAKQSATNSRSGRIGRAVQLGKAS